MGDLPQLTTKDFDATIAKGDWVIDFWAEWCGPCKIMAPHFEAVARESHGKVNFAKVDVDNNYDLADKFQVVSIPTTLVFHNGELVNRAVGALQKEQILTLVKDSF